LFNKVYDARVGNVLATTDNEQESKTVLIWNVNSCTELSNIPYAQKLPSAPKHSVTSA
jgi:hypothetical protein